MVELEVLHADVEGCLMASREETVGCPVCVHRLVSLVKCCKRVTEGDPTCCEVLVQAICLLEVLPGQVILVDQEVVGPLHSQSVQGFGLYLPLRTRLWLSLHSRSPACGQGSTALLPSATP